MDLLIYLIIVLIPIGVLIRIPIIGSAYLYPIDIPIILVFLFYLLKQLRKKNISVSPLFKKIGVFLAICFVCLLLNISWLSLPQFFVSFLYWVRIVIYLSVALAIVQYSAKNSKILPFLALSGFVISILGFIQYFFYQNLRNLFYLQWDDHLYRLFSTFLDPNFAGALFVLEILLLLYFVCIVKNALIKVIVSVALFLSILALFLTYSRSSLSMFLVSIIAFFLFAKKLRWLFVFSLVCLLGIIIIPKDFHIENMNLFRQASVIGRTDAYKNALFIFQKSPVYGVGFNAYRFAQKKYGLLDAKWEVTHAGAGVSNSYLFILVTTGIVGISSFFYMIWNILKELFYSRKIALHQIDSKNSHSDSTFYFACMLLSAVIGVGVHSIFENTLFYPFVLIWLLILFGEWYKRRITVDT